jgi:hypothetical protein
LEAPPGFEPGMEVLQTSALPLGDGAGRNSGDRKLTWNVRPRLSTQPTATSGEMVMAQARIAMKSSINRNGVCSSLLSYVPPKRANAAADEAAAY